MNWFKKLFSKSVTTSASTQPINAPPQNLRVRGGSLTLVPVSLGSAQAEWQRRRRSTAGTVVILIDPFELAEIKADAEEELPSETLALAAKVDLPTFFAARHDDLGLDEDEEMDEEFAIAHQEPDPTTLTRPKKPVKDFSGPTLGKSAFLSEIPCDQPWQVFAHYPFGGWNEVPFDQELTAVFKDWFDRFGAFPALISSDVIEFWLDQPVEDPAVAAKLAMEMFILCPDIVDQGTETVTALANSILGANVWFFWWD